MNLTSLALIIAQIEFIALVGLLVFLFVLQTRIKDRTELAKSYKEKYEKLKADLKRLSEKAEKKIKELAAIKQTVANLKKYKDLYFKLDKHIQEFSSAAKESLQGCSEDFKNIDLPEDAHVRLEKIGEYLGKLNPLGPGNNVTLFGEDVPAGIADNDDAEVTANTLNLPGSESSKAEELRQVIASQRKSILHLKHQLEQQEAGEGQVTISRVDLEGLENMLNQSETHAKAMETELFAARSKLEADKISQSRMEFLQQRVEELEEKEESLQYKLLEYKNVYTENQVTKERYNEMDKKISAMSNLLKEKELAISQYQNQVGSIESEYDRLFDSFQNMLSKHGVDHVDKIDVASISDQEMLDIQELQAVLESKEFELDRVRAECKLLEDCYLEISESSDSLKVAHGDMDSLIVERDSLKQELAKALEESKQHTEAIEENNQLRKDIKRLTVEAENIENIKERLKKKEDELERMRIEFNMMEEQYLLCSEYMLDSLN